MTVLSNLRKRAEDLDRAAEKLKADTTQLMREVNSLPKNSGEQWSREDHEYLARRLKVLVVEQAEVLCRSKIAIKIRLQEILRNWSA